MTPADLRAWRSRLGLPSWQAVADLLKVSRRTVQGYLQGRPIPPSVAELARLIEIQGTGPRHDGPQSA